MHEMFNELLNEAMDAWWMVQTTDKDATKSQNEQMH